MKTKVILGIVAILIFAIGITTMTSNMGFKLSQTLDVGITKYIALPYYNSYATQTAQLLRNDIVAACGGGTPTISVYNWNGSAWQRYSGGGVGQINFALTAGLGYQVVSNTAATNWVIVGSHNPSTTIPLDVGVTKYIAIPYHTTSTTAQLLRNELVAAAGGGTPTISVYNWNGTAWQRYSGGGVGQVNFNLTPGLAYQAVTNTTISGWLPAHY